MLTEQQNAKTLQIDRLSTLEMIQIINEEDATVAGAVRNALYEIARAVDAIVDRIASGGRLIYVGAGTSGRLAVLDAVECVPTFGSPPELVVAIIAGGQAALTNAAEGAEDDVQAGRCDLLAVEPSNNDAVVGIAASGRTPYVISALETANEVGAITIGLACNIPSRLLEISQIPIGIAVGPEVITGSTRLKAGTAQKMVLNMLSTATMVKLGKVYGNLMVDVRVSNAKLLDRARRIVAEVAAVDYEMASYLLEESNQEVKTAIVAHLKQVTPAQARTMLEAVGGRLRDIIGKEGAL